MGWGLGRVRVLMVDGEARLVSDVGVGRRAARGGSPWLALAAPYSTEGRPPPECAAVTVRELGAGLPFPANPCGTLALVLGAGDFLGAVAWSDGLGEGQVLASVLGEL